MSEPRISELWRMKSRFLRSVNVTSPDYSSKCGYMAAKDAGSAANQRWRFVEARTNRLGSQSQSEARAVGPDALFCVRVDVRLPPRQRECVCSGWPVG